MEQCSECNGRGEVNWGEVPSLGGIGGFVMETRPCAACHGTGVHVECRECLDCGEIATERNADGTWNLAGAYGPCQCEAGRRVAAERMRQVSEFEIDRKTVQAPGFEREQFLVFVERAKEAQLRTHPAGTPGTVLVQSGSSPSDYAVTRTRCECRGHQSVGRCYHRALVIWLADVQCVPVCAVPTIGVSKRGIPLTFGRKPATKAVAS